MNNDNNINGNSNSNNNNNWYIVEGAAFIYNLEHGIIPAALPQLRLLYKSAPFHQALTQCVSVFGTQLGLFLLTTYKVQLSKLYFLIALSGIAAGYFATRLIPIHDDVGIPPALYVYRFFTGVSASYIINVAPRWINSTFPISQTSAKQAQFQFFGIIGTVVGYVITLITSRTDHFVNEQTSDDTIDKVVWKANQGLHIAKEKAKEYFRRTTSQSDSKLQQAYQFLLDSLLTPYDFRRAFLWSALAALALTMIATFSLEWTSTREGERGRELEADEEGANYYVRVPSSTHDLIYSPFIYTPTPTTTTTARHQETSRNRRLPLAAIWRLMMIPEYIGVIAAVWIDTTTAQAINFWLFNAYTIHMNASIAKATFGVALVFVFGTVAGLGLSTMIKGFAQTPEQEIDGIGVPVNQLLVMVLFCCGAAVAGIFVCLVEGFWKLTLVLMLSVICGATVLPIAQAAVGLCAPEELHEAAYGFHQFAFQSCWFFGPLLPVILGWLGNSEMTGFRLVGILPVLGACCMSTAYYHRKRALKKASESQLSQTIQLSTIEIKPDPAKHEVIPR